MIGTEIPRQLTTQSGENLYNSSFERVILLTFLRHFGCIFCREAMKDLSAKRNDFAIQGVDLVFVHMSDEDTAAQYFDKYNLIGVDSISDPSCNWYKAFGLTKGTLNQLFGLKNWVRGFEVTLKDPMILSVQQIGDGFQMPGIFILHNGIVKESFIHRSAADRPDYQALIDCCVQSKVIKLNIQ